MLLFIAMETLTEVGVGGTSKKKKRKRIKAKMMIWCQNHLKTKDTHNRFLIKTMVN